MFNWLLELVLDVCSAACAVTSMSPRTFVYAFTCAQIRDTCADQDYTDIVDMHRLDVWIPESVYHMYYVYVYVYGMCMCICICTIMKVRRLCFPQGPRSPNCQSSAVRNKSKSSQARLLTGFRDLGISEMSSWMHLACILVAVGCSENALSRHTHRLSTG